MTKINLIPLDGACEIGVNSYYIEYGEKSFLIDCGADPRKEGFPQFTDLDKIRVKPDYLFISHAHLDHIGSFPFVFKKFSDIKKNLLLKLLIFQELCLLIQEI